MVALSREVQEQRMMSILMESQEKVRKNKQRLQAVNTSLHKERINLFIANVKINSQRIGDQLMDSLTLRTV